MHKAVTRGLSRRDLATPVAHVGLDEKSFQQGHPYATILSDLDHGRVIEGIEKRTLEASVTLLETGLSAFQKPRM